MTDSDRRTGPEWVTFAASLLVLAAVVVLIAVQMLGSHDPAAPVAVVAGPVRSEGGRHHVPVEVTNEGDETAEQVQVVAELVLDGASMEGDQVIDFLSGGEVAEVAFTFDDDPDEGELTVRVTGYSVP